MRRASSSSPRCIRMSANLTLGDGDGTHVAEPGVDRQLLLAADAQGLVELAALHQDVGDTAPGDGQSVLVVASRRDPAQAHEYLLRTIELAERHPPLAQRQQE